MATLLDACVCNCLCTLICVFCGSVSRVFCLFLNSAQQRSLAANFTLDASHQNRRELQSQFVRASGISLQPVINGNRSLHTQLRDSLYIHRFNDKIILHLTLFFLTPIGIYFIYAMLYLKYYETVIQLQICTTLE